MYETQHMPLIERKRTPVHEAADVLELSGLVHLADALRGDSALRVRFIEPVYRDQGSLHEIIERNADVSSSLVARALKMRSKMVPIAVGDLEALVDPETAEELRHVLRS